MKEQREVDQFLEAMSNAPDSQLDEFITTKLKTLIGKPIPEIKEGIMYSIDMCIYCALASDFALTTLHIIHENFCGGSDDDFTDENCPWRKELDDD